MMEAKNQQGKPVDWWFIYKTPEHSGSENNQGYEFFYYDPDSAVLDLSPIGLNKQNQALAHTLSGLFNCPTSSGYIVYNDEHVDHESDKSQKGHCKGVIAFDKASDSALFLLHSTPRFPASKEETLPDDEKIYGQTFICISLPDYQTANQIASQMLSQQNPQVLQESSRIPTSLKNDEPLYCLYHGVGVDESKEPSTLAFSSRGGKAFRLIAKSRKWGKDFWIDLISPELNTDLIVETWRRGKVMPEQNNTSSALDEDILTVCIKSSTSVSYEWSYTKDHSKWAVALDDGSDVPPWVCIADLNRMVSQEKRGGGSLCFQDPELWNALRNAEEKLHRPSVD